MKSPILLVCLLALALSAGAAVATNSTAIATNAPGNNQSLLTSAATVVVPT